MSTAWMPVRCSTSARICSVHGSAPKIPIRNDVSRGSSPRAAISSTIARKYDGVTMMIRAPKSRIRSTCRSVIPPDTGTTVHPSRSAP
jgi:hypothetical protein